MPGFDAPRSESSEEGPTFGDRHLVALACGGSSEAFDLLIERHLPSIQRLCWSMLCDRSDAEDAAQETFVRAYRCLNRYDAERAFAPWLRGIASKVCLQTLRKRGRRANRELSLEDSFYEPAAPEDEGPSQRAIEAVRALSQLKDTYRLPLALFYLEDASVAEVADALGISQGAARVRLHRGREQLREILMSEREVSDVQA